MRRTAAVWAGKATGALSRLSGRGGGTTLPGDVARAIDPTILRKLTGDLTEGSILITGTNGKTTTARLLTSIFEGMGKRVVSNRAGANLIFGATAAALRSAGPDGRLRADWGVFEIDEASLPRAVEEIQPRIAIVLNLFRDQIDRYGELEKIAKTIEAALESIPEGAQAVLNADDPRVGEIGLGLARTPLWFGIEDPVVAMRKLPHAADARTCPKCGASLRFSAVYLGHDGVYECPNGDFARPSPGVAATGIALQGFDSVGMNIGETRVELPVGGLYNAYNAVAAFAAGTVLGVDFEQLAGKAEAGVPAGTRAHDLAVRLKYAGVESRPPQTEPGRALDDLISVTPEGATAHTLCTYTAMLDIRAELVRRGWAKPYWET